MHTNMHKIQASAYRIHHVHMTYEHVYICLYVYVSQVTMSCIQCICVCMSDTSNRHTCRYTQICTPMGSAYLYVSVYIFVRNTCTYALMYPVHICMYLTVFLLHSCRFPRFLFARFGRPQARDDRSAEQAGPGQREPLQALPCSGR